MICEQSLSKFIATFGTYSRRAAEKLIRAGNVTICGKTIISPELKVSAETQVCVDGKPLTAPVEKIYAILNKPEGFLTTTSDDKGRATVMNLIPKKFQNKIYPVGRLDCASRGLLLLTNDGDLAYKLSHPKFMIQKTYFVTLDRNATTLDLENIRKGFFLHDGFIKADSVKFAFSGGRRRILISLHSGRNRIVRRIFLQLGYHVQILERVEYAGLNIKNLASGQIRLLSSKEVAGLISKTVQT